MRDPQAKLTALMDIILDFFSILFNSDPTFFSNLREEKFDMMIINFFPDMDFIANVLEIPIVIRVVMFPLEPAIATLSGNAAYHSSELSILTPKIFGLDPQESWEAHGNTIIKRLKNFGIQLILKGPAKWFMNYKFKQATPADLHKYIDNPRPVNLTLQWGDESVFAPIAKPANYKYIHPWINEIATEESTNPHIFEKSLQQFVDAHSQLFIIAFGSTFIPSNETMETILTFVAEN